MENLHYKNNKSLIISGIISGLLLVLLAAASYFVMVEEIKANRTSAFLVNMSGRQRMLMKSTALYSIQLVTSRDIDKRRLIRKELLDEVKLMERSHRALIESDIHIGLFGTPSTRIRSIYFNPPDSLDERLKNYIAHATSLASAPEAELTLDNSYLVNILNPAHSNLPILLDKVVINYQKESEQSIARLANLHRAIYLVTLLVIITMAFFIFRPLLKRLFQETIRLKESEAALAEAQHVAQIGNWKWDIESGALSWSDEIYRIFGLAPRESEANYDTFLNIIHPDDRNMVINAINAALYEKRPYNIDHRIVLSGNIERIVHEQGEVKFGENDEPISMLGTVQDITELKKVEDQSMLFRYLLDRSTDAIFVNDAGTGRILDVNDKACDNLGYERGELLQMRVMDIEAIMPDDFSWERHMEDLDQKGSELLLGEHKRKDGSTYPAEISVTNIIRGSNKYNVAVVRNISERKDAEQALSESEEKYRSLFEEALDAIFVGDPETGEIIDCNRAASELTGKSRSELIGIHQRELHPPEEQEGEFSRTFRKHLEEKEGGVLDAQVVASDGEIKDVAIKAKLFKIRGKKVIQGIFRDITKQKRVEFEKERIFSELLERDEALAKNVEALQLIQGELEEKNDALKEVNSKLKDAYERLLELDQVKSDFVANVSHELRTPLTSIKAYAEILLDDLEQLSVAEKMHFLKTIDTESDRLTRLIDNLLDLRKIETLSLIWNDSEMDIDELIIECADQFKLLAEKYGVSISVEVSGEGPVVNTDRDRIKQVIGNLLSNAVDFSKAGDKITIRSKVLNDHGQEGMRDALVSVGDEGIGISSENQDKIFERFEQISDAYARKRGGTGLGLAICKEIVEHYGGNLRVESSPGKGSTFSFNIPLSGYGEKSSRG